MSCLVAGAISNSKNPYRPRDFTQMSCLVAGANFLLRAIRDEAFTFSKGVKQFVALDEVPPPFSSCRLPLFPALLPPFPPFPTQT